MVHTGEGRRRGGGGVQSIRWNVYQQHRASWTVSRGYCVPGMSYVKGPDGEEPVTLGTQGREFVGRVQL